MTYSLAGSVLKYGGAALMALGLLVAVWALLADQQSIVWRYWLRYLGSLERKLRLMFIWTPARYIGMGQLACALIILTLAAAIDLPLWYVWLGAVAGGPVWYIERLRRKRVAAIEDQLDGFLTALANALKTTPSIGSALVSILPILRKPMRDEVELATKEMRVGSTLDQALLNMASRVGSRQLDSGLSAIVIGRQIGGDLPRILESTANTLREMNRLEGVVRTKTAEGKAQLWVLAVFPFFIIAALNAVSKGYFDPLSESLIGYGIAFAAGFFWLASLVVARKVLSVDI